MRRRSNLGKMYRLNPKRGAVPPHNLDMEASVLSAVLLDKTALDSVVDFLRPEHFYSEANSLIYGAALELQEAGTPIDVVSVADYLRAKEWMKKSGGAAYIAQLADATPAVAHMAAHAKVVYEKWRLRQLIATCQRVSAGGYSDVGDVQAYIDDAEQAVYDIARIEAATEYSKVGPILQVVFKRVAEAAERGDKITGTSTGYVDFDDRTAGLHDGDLMIVAARPGMGKTSFVLNLAVNVAAPREVVRYHGEPPTLEPGLGVGVFSLEMPREQLATRMVCCEAKVDLGRMRKAMLQPDDWRRLTEAAAFIGGLPVWIDDTPAISLLELRARVRRMQAECGRPDAHGNVVPRLGAVVIDYLQLMSGRDGVSSREQEISEISRGLKQIAKELKVPVIALSQLNRSVEARQDKRPQLSDLRESGAIEQDADTIVFIYRRDYYEKERTPEDWKGIAELIIAKQRNGPTGTVLTRFLSPCTRFDNLARTDYPSDFDSG